MKISEHISFDEATKSQTAIRKNISNIPNEHQLQCMKDTAEACFEPLRKWWGKPLIISSFFRCEALNEAVGGSKTSQHCKGEAMDIDTGDYESNKKIFEWCKSNLVFDQLINEYDFSWVHISFSKNSNRNQTLIIK